MDGDTRIKNWLTDQAWVAILVTFFTIALSIVLSEIQTRVGWGTLIVSLITVVGIYTIITWLNLKYVFAISLKLSRDIQEKIDNYVGFEKKGWILTVPQLVEFEKNVKAPEIWLISGDLAEDVIGEPFFEAVQQNIRRGVNYRYFVPDRPEIRARVSQIQRHYHTTKSTPIQVTYLNADFFFLVPNLDFVIYNPYRGNTDVERVCYMGLPVPEEETHYEVKISDDLIDVLIGKLIPIIED